MSLLPADVRTSLQELLHALSSTDNTLRGTAEEQLQQQWVVQRPDVLLMGLVEQMAGTGDRTV